MEKTSYYRFEEFDLHNGTLIMQFILLSTSLDAGNDNYSYIE